MSDERGPEDDRHDRADIRNADSVTAVYERTLPYIYGYLLRRVNGHRPDAEELTQETYLAYVETVRKGVAIDSPEAWLQTVARNKLVDHFRRRNRSDAHKADTRDVVEPEVMTASTDVEALLHSLPNLQRAAVILHYLDDLPVHEVASLLKRSVRATESLLARARRRLANESERERTREHL